MADLFAPLSDPTLLRLLEFIFEGDRTMPECGAYLDLPEARVERHLRNLTDSGWIKERLVGERRWYGPPSAQVVEFMTLAGSMASERSTALASCTRLTSSPRLKPGDSNQR